MSKSNKKSNADSEQDDPEESGLMEHILQSHISMAMLVSKLVQRENEILEECIACQLRNGEHDDECEYKELVDFVKRINTLVNISEEEDE